MHAGAIYFINHKTKDYFSEGSGLFNLSISILRIQGRLTFAISITLL